MSDKVKLTKEQASIVQSLLDEGKSSVEYTLKQHVIDRQQWSGENLLPLREMTFDTLVRAFYIGYEVELSIQEQLLEKYNKFSGNGYDQYRDAYRQGMRDALDIVPMKVKGING
ncbi:hypothetical protein [Paenibacillus rhizophilus]|uniref:Uncharacterized protein n=1 Tax=Paenibacillus rhizophilus TaxID=1850366 RepID=A0A3N9P2J4_9BACL|nr:hypothetical protein [Paenibacillus rhizophilus]RQW10398.1 hypothetical protein EH198_16410 [Paenibacillus rhizophilus]